LTSQARINKSAPNPAAHSRRLGGRPSRTEAEQISTRILDAATELFFSRGYGATSIEAIAKRVRISKRTFYHRFADKPALFAAVVHRIIGGLRPPASVPIIQGTNLEDVLERIARLILDAATSPIAVCLYRLMVAESSRFPELAQVVTREGATAEAIGIISGILDREVQAGRLAIGNTNFAAQQFIQMIVSGPQRRALGLWTPLTPADLDTWPHNVVNLFINGCRGWRGTKPG